MKKLLSRYIDLSSKEAPTQIRVIGYIFGILAALLVPFNVGFALHNGHYITAIIGFIIIFAMLVVVNILDVIAKDIESKR